MRIVIVKPIMPWPATQGTRRVTVGLLRALSTSHDVTLVAPALDREDRGSAKELERKFGIRVITTLAPNRLSIAHRAFYRAASPAGFMRARFTSSSINCSWTVAFDISGSS